MFFLLKETSRDWILVVLVGLIALAANLPEEYTSYLSLNRQYLLVALIVVVGVSLIKYLKFTLVLVVFFLAIGANLPADIAGKFGVDNEIMLIGLIILVAVALANKLLKLQTGLDKTGRATGTQGAALLLQATIKGRTPVVQSLVQAGINVNVRTVSGKTPLMAAAAKGYSDIVTLLLSNGADADIKDATGNSALKYAERGKFTRTVDILKRGGATE